MRNVGLVVAMLALAAGSAVPALGAEHSDNMSLLANYSDGGKYRQGSDLAFWGDRAVLGNYGGPGGFRLMDISSPAAPTLIGQLNCPGPQNDVSIWKDLVFVSVDSPRAAGPSPEGAARKAEECGAPGATNDQIAAGAAWEGVRIVSIADPARPVQIAAIKTDCGSHTHTLVPDEAHGRLLVYVLSYPLGAPFPSCNVGSHRKISVIDVPLANPQAAKVVATPDVSPSIGCHDVTIFVPRKLAGAACISESQLWDISDPVHPKILSHIANPAINIHHSSSFSWDGNTMVLGDELGGAEVTPGCLTPQDITTGGLWFYDVKDPAKPTMVGRYKLPQTVASHLCTAHLFNIVPLRSEKDILVSSWYTGATTVVDFTDPSKPKQIAFYIPDEPVVPGKPAPAADAWSSYWYNGRIYSNNFDDPDPTAPALSRGLDIFTVNHPDLATAITLDRLNPQIQEPLPAVASTAGAEQSVGLPSDGPATGSQSPSSGRKACVSRRNFRIRIHRRKGVRIRSAVVFVNGRRTKVVRGKRLGAPIDLRGLPKGRFRVDITVTTKSGRRISSSRTYRTCIPKKRGSRRG